MAYLCRRRPIIHKRVSLRSVTQCTCLHSHLHGAGARRLAFHHHSARVQPVTYVATKFTSLDDRWRCSNLYYKSKYLHQTSTHSSLTLYQDFLIKRPYHTSRQLFKEESNDLKQKESSDSSSLSEKTSDKNNLENATSSSTDSSVVQKKETLWEKVVGFLRHYYNGFKLFFLELRICLPLMYKYLKSGRSSMKRREHIQLTKTLGDVFRIMPLIPMLIIPFAELLIPFYVKLGLMPTTFQSKKDKEEQNKLRLKKKIEWAKLITETLSNMPKKERVEGTRTLQDFTKFMEKVKSRKVQPPTEEIVKFSRLFEDEITMKHLSMQQLQALCQVLGLVFTAQIPSEKILRFQLRMKLRELEVDDKMIQKEGIDSLTIPELQQANKNRGMRAFGMSEERLRAQLEQWLELHLQEKIPSSLLLLSRTIYLQKELSPIQKVQETISVLPEETVETTKITSAVESGEQIDNKTLLEMLKKEAQEIKEEEEADKKEKEAELLKAHQEAELLKAQAEAQAKAAEAEAEALGLGQVEAEPKPAEPVAVEVEIKEKEVPLPDIAEPIVAKPSEEFKEAEGEVGVKVLLSEEAREAAETEAGQIGEEEGEEKEEEVTPKDIGDIEAAIEHITLHEKEELEDVKEDIDEYKESLEQIRALSYSEREAKESAAAKTLRKYVDRLISNADKVIDDLQKDRAALKEKIEFTEVKLKYEDEGKEQELLDALTERKESLVSINEVLLALKRLQKVPDDVRLQKILQVLDEDQDGYIDIKNVLDVTEALGRENLKLSTSQVSNIVTLLRKETELEFEEKIKIKMEKEENKDKSPKNSETENGKLSQTVEEREKVKSEEKSS